MKQIIAFIQPFKEAEVMQALHQVSGLSGATFADVKGFGRGRPRDQPTPEILHGTAARVQVEVMVRDEIAEAVVHAIREAAHTGGRGDGKIYVLPMDRALRISTGEEGDDAV